MAQKSRFSFSKEERICKKKEFEEIFKHGEKVEEKFFLLYKLEGERRKIGIITSRKCGKACRRNRIKRLIREVYRLNKEMLKDQTKIVIIVKEKIKEIFPLSYDTMKQLLFALFKKAKLIE